MTSILCLAHYCDTHGPTPLMVTEESPVACSTCYSETYTGPTLPDTPLPSAAVSRNTSFETPSQPQQPSMPTQAQDRLGTQKYTPNTPPASPRIQALAPKSRRDSSFRKTYDDADKKRAIPCENCALTLPKAVAAQQKSSQPDTETNQPIFKTRQPYAVIWSSTSTPISVSSSSDSETDADPTPLSQASSTSRASTRRKSLRRSITGSAASSTSSLHSETSHAHYIEYTSAHDPISSTSFSLLRAACLRTLSCETLPPPRPAFTPAPSTVASPTSPFSAAKPFLPSFPSGLPTTPSSTPSSPASGIGGGGVGYGVASGGPLLFGDPQAGYTTAFIFRIPDPCARGRRRQYAFICLSRCGETKAVRQFGLLKSAFAELAAWVRSLAEAESEKLEQENYSNYAGGSSGYSAGLREARANSVNDGRGDGPRSSFLSGRQAGFDGDRGGIGMGIRGVRSRGLAELVGQPGFFLQLHVRFVEILARLRFLENN